MPISVIEILTNFSGAVAMAVIFYFLIHQLVSTFTSTLTEVAQKYVEESDKNRDFLQQQQDHFIESITSLGEKIQVVDNKVTHLDHKVDVLQDSHKESKHIIENMYKHNKTIAEALKRTRKIVDVHS